MLAAFAPSVMAHEFWLEPQQFVVSQGDTAGVDIRIGETFKGRVYPYIENQTEQFFWVDAQGRKEVESITGDKPAAKRTLDASGYLMVGYESDVFSIRFNDADKFLNYIRAEGLDHVERWYEETGADLSKVTESYYRHAKALMGTPDAEEQPWMTEPLGLRIEIVPEAGFTDCSRDAFFQVRVEGEPLEGLLVRRFQEDRAAVFESRTDEEGWVRFPPGEGPFLVSSVYIESGEGNPRAFDRDWVSDWGSFTYACRN